MQFSEVLHLDCDCLSIDHIIRFSYENDPEYASSERIITIDVSLVNYKGFWKRLWYGLKYAFGYRCRFGAWDEFLFEAEEQEQLRQMLKKLK